MKNTVQFILCAILMLTVSAFAQATGDPERGSQKKSMCAGCHGIADWRTAYPDVYSVPRLGGQHAAYIVKALSAYKSGARKHPTMNAIASSLTEQDMADLAAYYSGGN
ncbi:MAG TPA: cytochrome c [Burkholderiales bacterium]|nr:cytochrome c [Burkholderiales bacterium]